MSQLIVFFSPKGGTGKSTLAANMALELRKTHPGCKVAVLDLNIYNPDMPVMFKIENDQYALNDYFAMPEIGLQNTCVTRNGVDVYAPERDYRWFSFLSKEKIETVIEELKSNYNFVVVDTHSTLDLLPTYIAVVSADFIINVVNPNILSLRASDRAVQEYMTDLGLEAKMLYVLNRCTSEGISPDMARQEIGIKKLFCISESPSILKAVNLGRPFYKIKDRDVRKAREEIINLISIIDKEAGRWNQENAN